MSLADEVIKRARDRIDAGWAQWESSDRTRNNVCLTYAINEAADEVSASMPEMPTYEVVAGQSQAHVFKGPDQLVAEVNARVGKAIAELNPAPVAADSMIVFNDTASDKGQVLAVLDRALALK